MSHEQWTAVDRYITELLVGPDAALEQALRASDAAGLPSIAVSPAQGKLLHLLARIHGRARILELGTLGGYSTIWLARALPPGGHLVSLEAEPALRRGWRGRTRTCRASTIGSSCASARRRTRCADSSREGHDPFDLIFIDADKQSIPEYFELGAGALAARQPDHHRQRRPRRLADRGESDDPDDRDAPLPRAAARELARQRHDDPDRGPEGLRRLHARARLP